jgi:uncharacterized membrane protein
MDTPDLVQVLLIVVAAVQTIHYYNIMPAVVASHFNAAGVPNGWSPKSDIFVLYWIVIGVAVVIARGIPALMGVLPPSMVNLPNKAYWLSEDRWPQAKALLKFYFKWFGSILLLLFVVVFQLVFKINLTHDPALGNYFWMLLVIFFVLVTGWSIAFWSTFVGVK